MLKAVAKHLLSEKERFYAFLRKQAQRGQTVGLILKVAWDVIYLRQPR